MDKVFITPQMASEFLQRNNSNRAISESTVKRYAEYMKNGYWSETPLPIVFDEYGVLLDGQHRLSALVKANKSFYFYVATDKRENYSKYDNGKKRNASDLLSSKGYKNTRVYTTAIAGVYSYINGGRNTAYKKMTPEKILLYVESNKNNKWDELCSFSFANRKVFNRSVPLGMYLMLKDKYEVHDIMLYLNDIAKLNNQETNVPTLVYRYIMETLKANQKVVFAHMYYDVLLTGFTHYLKGNSLQYLKIRDTFILKKELGISYESVGLEE